MKVTDDSLRAKYRSLDTDELLELFLVGELTANASAILTEELSVRQVNTERIRAFKQRQAERLADTPRRLNISQRQITRKDLQEAYEEKRRTVRSKRGIKGHLKTYEHYYTPSARKYLIEIARNEGLSDTEINTLIKKAERNQKRWDSWQGLLEQLSATAIVLFVIFFLLVPTFNYNHNLGVVLSIIFVALVFWYLWKRWP
jgi:hypothetical protein